MRPFSPHLVLATAFVVLVISDVGAGFFFGKKKQRFAESDQSYLVKFVQK